MMLTPTKIKTKRTLNTATMTMKMTSRITESLVDQIAIEEEEGLVIRIQKMVPRRETITKIMTMRS
jgi:hypothetical protein